MQPALLDAEPPIPDGDLRTDPLLSGRASVRLEALGLMTAGIVHDLGNMIQILSSTVDVLDQHPTIRATTALQPAIDRAINSLERARALIKQILSFARDTGTRQENVDIAMCLAQMERLLRWIGKNDMRIAMRADAGMPPVNCHRGNLENAILNLALNARDAMPEGGVLSIRAAASRDRDGTVTGVALRVSDNGRGMTQETMARAFDPFFTTKTGTRGTGLGLTMVRRFAQETGGSVAIESASNHGTAVTLRLPLQPARGP
ncbi:MAG TPA: ATP-binding protein [Hyphomicrobiaceae bacterium]|nr:ATP-binding protein [Hyphomicrobiaceae bacterium]